MTGRPAEQPKKPKLDLWFQRVFDDEAPSHFGTGWLSGTASVFLGAIALGAVGVLWFPEWFSTAQFRPLYPLQLLRKTIGAVIALAFGLGTLSLLLRRRKVLGATGCGLAMVASLLGGGNVEVDRALDDRWTLGLDWFLLNLFLLALLFVPLERLFPKWPEQGPFRIGWTTDTLHFLSSHALVQAMSFLILLPATTLAGIWQPEGFQGIVRSQPLALQLVEVVIIADLAQYAVHRAFHRVPLLWRFHHWHHAAADAARDKNFAVHLPWLDRLFGSLYLPRQQGWPDRYGIAGDPVPQGYGGQLAYPFRVVWGSPP